MRVAYLPNCAQVLLDVEYIAAHFRYAVGADFFEIFYRTHEYARDHETQRFEYVRAFVFLKRTWQMLVDAV